MAIDFSNFPISPSVFLGVGIYATVSAFGTGPFVNDRELVKMDWPAICEANLQADIFSQRKQSPASAIPKFDCQSIFGVFFGQDGKKLCRNHGNFNIPIPGANALREQERRVREAENRRIERVASRAGSRCECASAVYQAEQIIPLAIYAGSARLIIPSQIRNIQAELDRALRSPQCTGE